MQPPLLGSSGIVTMMKQVKPGLAHPAWLEENVADDKGATNNWQELALELADNAELLEAVRESLENSEPDTGWSRTNIFDVPKTFVHRRNAAQWLARATLYSLYENQFPAALENLHALFKLTQVQKDDVWLVNQMIQIAIAGLAISTTWETLQAEHWDDSQLARLQADLDSIDLLDAVEKGFVGERVSCLELFQWARSNNRINGRANFATKPTLQDRISGEVWSAVLAERDELLYLEITQQNLEHIRLVRKGTKWPEIAALLDDDLKQVVKRLDSFQALLQPVTRIAIPSTIRALRKAIQVETQRQLTLAAVALKRYQLRYGKLPVELSMLVPEFLSELPRDWMDQKPIKYRVTENGFVLYSVGEDGRDDGGDPAPAKSLGKEKYELWSGRDAVWPEANLPNPNLAPK